MQCKAIKEKINMVMTTFHIDVDVGNRNEIVRIKK